MSEDVEIRAARAQQLLDDEVLAEALQGYVTDVVARLLRADLKDTAECVASVAAFQASQEFQNQLRSFVTAGKAAERKPFKVA
jgi:hypothetical protein